MDNTHAHLANDLILDVEHATAETWEQVQKRLDDILSRPLEFTDDSTRDIRPLSQMNENERTDFFIRRDNMGKLFDEGNMQAYYAELYR